MKVRWHHLFNYYLQYCTNMAQFKIPKTEKTVDPDLDVLENSHWNVCSEVLSKAVACQLRIC